MSKSPFRPRSRIAVLAIALALAGGPASGQDEAQGASPPEDPLAAFADGLAAAYLYDHNLPGLTISVTAPDAVRVLRGYGFADVDRARPVDPETTLFRIGSISKTFIWTAVMMQVDAGRLDLDADVNEYLDEIEIPDTFPAPVTMRHLMTHTPGFEIPVKLFVPRDDDPRSLAEVLSMSQPARVFPPGARTSYSNWGSGLAAHIVERVAGKPYDRVLREDLLLPLGMNDTCMAAPGALEPPAAARLATGYAYTAGRHQPTDLSQLGPFESIGAIVSTAADMTRWMRFHLNGGELDGVRLLSPEAHAVLWQRAFDDPAAATGVSHGFQVKMNGNLTVIGHGGTTAAFLSDMMLAPELGIGVYASQNSAQTGGGAAVRSITQRIIERAAELQGVALTPGTPGTMGDPAEYAGAYVNNRRPFTTMARVFWLPVTLSVAPSDDGGLVVSTGSTAYRYLPVVGAPDLFENARGERIRFLRDADGTVVAVQDGMGVHSHERVTGVDAPATLGLLAGAVLLLAITTLLGFWRRWKHVPERTAAGRRAASVAFIGACVVLAYVAVTALALAEAASLGAADYGRLPTTLWKVFGMAGYVLAATAALAVVALWPAWNGSAWPVLRRLHYSAFALGLAGLAWMLWYWRFYAAPYI